MHQCALITASHNLKAYSPVNYDNGHVITRTCTLYSMHKGASGWHKTIISKSKINMHAVYVFGK